MDNIISRQFQVKKGRNQWVDEYLDTDPESVYKWLADEMANKYIHHMTHIKSIKYDGHARSDNMVQYIITYKPTDLSKTETRNVFTVER